MSAIIEVRPGLFIHTIWQAARPTPLPIADYPPHAKAEMLAVLVRDGTKPWELRTRLRLVVDDKVFGSADKKLTRSLSLSEDEAESYAAASRILDYLLVGFSEHRLTHEVRLDGSDARAVIASLRKIPGMNVTHVEIRPGDTDPRNN